MKHYLPNSLRALFLSLAVLLSMPMLAVEVEIDGIRYDLVAETKQATVVSKSGYYSGEVVIPESVEHEGNTYSVTSIGEWAFNYCDGLTSVTIGNSVKSIGYGAFYSCSGLTSFTIPNSVTSIGDGAFYSCSGLISVTIPNSVTSIGNDAFWACSGLTSVHISDIIAWCNIDFEWRQSNPLYYAHHLYLNGEEVKDLVIPNSVTSIRNYAFFGCSGLASVTIPNSVRSIGEGAFYGCDGLNSVTIPNSVESIRVSAFSYCSELLDVYCYAENVPSTDSYAFVYSPIANATLHVPAGSVDSYNATAPWNGFGKIVAISTEVDGINYDFDAETQQATVIAKSSGEYSGEVVIPESVVYMGNAYSVTSIGYRAFANCDGMTSVTIPHSVTSIVENAFQSCSGLTSVTIPNSVTSIGDWAFSYCDGLTSVTIPNSVTSIGSGAFSYCI